MIKKRKYYFITQKYESSKNTSKRQKLVPKSWFKLRHVESLEIKLVLEEAHFEAPIPEGPY